MQKLKDQQSAADTTLTHSPRSHGLDPTSRAIQEDVSGNGISTHNSPQSGRRRRRTSQSSISNVMDTQGNVLSGGALDPHSGTVDPLREAVEQENLSLHRRVAGLEDDLMQVSREKDSLLHTLQLMQDELMASERKQRTRTK